MVDPSIQEAVAWLREMADVYHDVPDAERWLSWADAIEAREREIGRLTQRVRDLEEEANACALAEIARTPSPSKEQGNAARDAAVALTHLPASAPPLGSPAPDSGTFYSEAHVLRLRGALEAARGLISGMRERDFERFTFCGDPETMDSGEREIIAEYDTVLAQIDEVMK